MNDRKRALLFSIPIMTCVALVVGAVSLFSLYHTAFEEQRERLVETVRSRACLIEAVARFDAMYTATDVPGGPEPVRMQREGPFIDASLPMSPVRGTLRKITGASTGGSEASEHFFANLPVGNGPGRDGG